MQITDEMVEAAWLRYQKSLETDSSTGELSMRAALEAALGANTVSEDAAEIVKDLMSLSHPMAECMSDGMRLTALIQIANKAAACIEDLAELVCDLGTWLRVGKWERQNGVDNEIRDITERWGLK